MNNVVVKKTWEVIYNMEWSDLDYAIPAKTRADARRTAKNMKAAPYNKNVRIFKVVSFINRGGEIMTAVKTKTR